MKANTHMAMVRHEMEAKLIAKMTRAQIDVESASKLYDSCQERYTTASIAYREALARLNVAQEAYDHFVSGV